MDEISLIYQCVFCGSYSLWVIGALDPHEIHLRVKFSKLKRQQHEAEQDIMLEHSRAKFDQKVAFLPCTTCLEHHRGKKWSEVLAEDWLRGNQSSDGNATDQDNFVNTPVGLSPTVPVRFLENDAAAGKVEQVDEATGVTDDDLPPVYRRVAGKWTLAQGVGPKVLELLKDTDSLNRLPAQQFKVLLKGRIFPLFATDQTAGRSVDANRPKGGNASRSKIEAQKKQSMPSSPSKNEWCSSENVRGFLDFVWSEVQDYEDRLKTILLQEEPDTFAKIRHFVVSPVFCANSDDLAALESCLQWEVD